MQGVLQMYVSRKVRRWKSRPRSHSPCTCRGSHTGGVRYRPPVPQPLQGKPHRGGRLQTNGGAVAHQARAGHLLGPFLIRSRNPRFLHGGSISAPGTRRAFFFLPFPTCACFWPHLNNLEYLLAMS